MKKWYLLLLIIMCTTFTACKKDETTDVEQIDIPGVEVVDNTCEYTYTFDEQQDKTLLLTVKGSWESEQKWNLRYDKDVVATVEELSQSDKETQYKFSPIEDQGGYSEYILELIDTNTQKVSYTFIISLMVSLEDKKVTVLDVYYFEPSETQEEVGEEETMDEESEDNPEDQEMEEEPEEEYEEEYAGENAISEADATELKSKINIPEEFEQSTPVVKVNTDRKEQELYLEITFAYDEEEYICVAAPDTPLSYYQKQKDEETDLLETREINEVEILVYDNSKGRMLMWKDLDGVRYVLVERRNSGEKVFEVVKLLLNH